jgi:hypothetical protein
MVHDFLGGGKNSLPDIDEGTVRVGKESYHSFHDSLIQKLELIAALKPGEGVIIASEYEGREGIQYLDTCTHILVGLIENENRQKGLFNEVMIPSLDRKGHEMKYREKEYHVEIPELKEGELYPEMIIRRGRR